jgi:hypothetical protein
MNGKAAWNKREEATTSQASEEGKQHKQRRG